MTPVPALPQVSAFIRRYRVECALALFVAANVAAIVAIDWGEPIWFHLIWLSFAIAYLRRLWSFRMTVAFLIAVVASSGGALVWRVSGNEAGMDEALEVPLLAGMFLVIVWQVQRRERALEREIRQMAETHLEQELEYEREESRV